MCDPVTAMSLLSGVTMGMNASRSNRPQQATNQQATNQQATNQQATNQQATNQQGQAKKKENQNSTILTSPLSVLEQATIKGNTLLGA